MTEFARCAAFAVLLWWFTTGIILWLDGLPRRTFGRSMAAATLLLGCGLYELRASAADPSSIGAYTAFSCAIVVWGWLEMSFLMGFITGPRKRGCPERCGGARHFIHAASSVIYNEIATLSGALALLAATWGAPNRTALWTFLLLWVMRLSAKLNLFLGVPNRGEQFLPAHLEYLKTFFGRRAMNPLFPLSVLASAAALIWLVRRFLHAPDAFHGTSAALLASLLALALLEHCFMVIPLPSEKLWSWAMRREKPPAPRAVGAPQVNSAKTC